MKQQSVIVGITLVLITVGFSGCINVPKELTQFSIVSFDVEPGIINQGESANLSWVVISASSVNIDNGIGSVALTGHRIIQPTQTTTYILTASNATTTKSETVTITVNNESNESNNMLESIIISFEVNPMTIERGESANLSWVVTGATTVAIDNGIGSVALTGHRIIQPTQNTTYILTASNATTTRSATVTINVNKDNNTINPEKDEFVGTWVNSTYIDNIHYTKTIIFFSNGTAVYGGYPLTWDLKESKLILSYEGVSETQNYTFSNNNNTLYLASSNLFHFATTYTKQ